MNVLLGLIAAAAFGQMPDTLEASLEARIGAADGVGPAAFGRVEAVELGPDGAVFVLDGLAHELRAFSASGSHSWTVGREGEGPGEFLAPFGLTVDPNGALLVFDPENQRATTVTRMGEVLDTRHVPGGIALSPWPGRFDLYGNLYSYRPDPTEGYAFEIVRFDERARPTARMLPPREGAAEFFEGRTERGSHMRARVPFTPRLVWRIDSRGRFVWASTDAVRYWRRDADGGDVELLSLEISRPPVTSQDLTAALEGLRRFEQRGGSVERSRIPDRKPPLETFVLDERDRIWSFRASGARASQSLLDVFDTDGTHIALVVLPFRLASVPTPVVRGGRIVGVERDEFGVDEVVVATLPAMPR